MVTQGTATLVSLKGEEHGGLSMGRAEIASPVSPTARIQFGGAQLTAKVSRKCHPAVCSGRKGIQLCWTPTAERDTYQSFPWASF